jgi:hypothetical protein
MLAFKCAFKLMNLVATAETIRGVIVICPSSRLTPFFMTAKVRASLCMASDGAFTKAVNISFLSDFAEVRPRDVIAAPAEPKIAGMALNASSEQPV